jgi:hypothetical protein
LGLASSQAPVSSIFSSVETSHGFEVLVVASMKMGVFWVVAPYSLVEIYPEVYQTSQCNNPKDTLLQNITFLYFFSAQNLSFKISNISLVKT